MPNEKSKQNQKPMSLWSTKDCDPGGRPIFCRRQNETWRHSFTLEIDPVHRYAKPAHVAVLSQSIGFDGVRQIKSQYVPVAQLFPGDVQGVLLTLSFSDRNRLEWMAIDFHQDTLLRMCVRNQKSSELHRQIEIGNMVQSKYDGSLIPIRPTKFRFWITPAVPQKLLRFGPGEVDRLRSDYRQFSGQRRVDQSSQELRLAPIPYSFRVRIDESRLHIPKPRRA